MSLSGEQVLLRVYLASADRSPHTPTYQRVLQAARNGGLKGATVLKGILGAGSCGVIPAPGYHLAEHVPVIVELVDTADRISDFIAGPLRREMPGGLATLERAHVVMYRERALDRADAFRLGTPIAPLSTLPQIPEVPDMTVNQDGILLRVFAGESDRFQNQPLHEAIVLKVRELGLAGATVLRGAAGFGANSVVHTSHLLEMSTDLPIVIEIVDTEPKIKLLLPYLETMVNEGMITMEYVVILMYRHAAPAAPAPTPPPPTSPAPTPPRGGPA